MAETRDEPQPGDVIRWLDADGTEHVAYVGPSPEWLASRTPAYATGRVRTASGRYVRV